MKSMTQVASLAAQAVKWVDQIYQCFNLEIILKVKSQFKLSFVFIFRVVKLIWSC